MMDKIIDLLVTLQNLGCEVKATQSSSIVTVTVLHRGYVRLIKKVHFENECEKLVASKTLYRELYNLAQGMKKDHDANAQASSFINSIKNHGEQKAVKRVSKAPTKAKTVSRKHQYVYIVSFDTYGTGVAQDYIDSLNTYEEAKTLRTQLINCGHTNVCIHKARVR